MLLAGLNDRSTLYTRTFCKYVRVGQSYCMTVALSTHALFANTLELVKAIASDPSASIVRRLQNFLFWLSDVDFRVSCRPSLKCTFP